MELRKLIRQAGQLLLATTLLVLPANFYATPSPQSPPNIGVSGNLSANKIKRGHSVQGTIVMDIPAGYHVNSNKPLEKFLVATQLQIEPSNGLRVGPVTYPRAVLRTFKFSKNKVSVYEGRAVMRFSVSVPANAGTDAVELKVRLRYQSCNDEVCFPPKTQEVNMNLGVVGAGDSAKRINGGIFGSG